MYIGFTSFSVYLTPSFTEIPKVLLYAVERYALWPYFNLFVSERERAMLFPDYYFLAERRLVYHTIETRKVKSLDDCELYCYLEDNCVSLNFKNDPENIGAGHICELNNATHLKYEGDLTTDAFFYYRGSEVSYG